MILPLIEAGPEIGIGGGAQFIHANLFGGKEFLRIVIEGSTERQEWYEAEFEDPQILRTPYAGRAHLLRRIIPNRRFFGLGARTRERDETDHHLRSTEIALRLERGLPPGPVAWIGSRFQEAGLGAGSIGRVPDTRDRYPDLPGIRGGHLATFSAGAALDRVAWTRNEAGYPISPQGGYRIEIDGETAGADTGDFQKQRLGGRAEGYLALPRPGHVLAAQIAGDVTGAAHTPFWELPSLGGRDTLRGHIDGRFVGFHRLYGNAEYRFPILDRGIQRLIQGVQGTLFYDVGRVYDRREARTLEHLAGSAGAGVRFILRPGVIARLDYGVSNEDSIVWFIFRLPF